MTPFAYAAAAGHVEWCRWFIERADPGARPSLLKQAAAAVEKGNSQALAAELLHAGWKPDPAEAQRWLVLAVQNDDLPLTRAVLPFCQTVAPRQEKDDPFSLEQPDVLVTAALNAGRDVMQCVLAATASLHPEVWRSSVNEALDTAIDHDKLPAFDLLLATNPIDARPAKEDRPGKASREAPLSGAVTRGRARMVQALLAKGHKPEIGDDLLRLAIENGHSELIPQLLKAGASVAERDKDGVTALHVAANLGDEEAVRALLAAGASPAEKMKDGLTASDLADKEGYPDLADDLRARAAAKK
jgi:ankyrin repeat protein